MSRDVNNVFRCKVCDKVYGSKQGQTIHVRQKHLDIDPYNDDLHSDVLDLTGIKFLPKHLPPK